MILSFAKEDNHIRMRDERLTTADFAEGMSFDTPEDKLGLVSAMKLGTQTLSRLNSYNGLFNVIGLRMVLVVQT